MTVKRILIVEDDEDIASALARGLRREGFEAIAAFDSRGALAAIEQGCSAAVVDVMLGHESGVDLVSRLRRDGHTLPIVMLSALSSVDDRAAGLEAGADDYVAKPFEMAELVARLQVQERRRSDPAGAGPVIDHTTREVRGSGKSTTLTQRELDLLEFLLGHRDEVVSRGEIFDSLWLNEGGSSENVVDVYIGYLRRKLSPPMAFGLEIRTVRGRGFVLTTLGES